MKTAPTIPSRDREVARIRAALERLHSPRLQMMLIVALTAATGFLASVTMLSGGLHAMWLRYPLAVLSAYLGFLFFLWCWLRLRWEDFVEVPDFGGRSSGGGSSAGDAPLPWSGGVGGRFGGAGASGSFADTAGASSSVPATGDATDLVSDAVGSAGSALDLEELTVVIVALVALAVAVCAAFWIVWIAPALFAELTLDAALATGLYRRLRHVGGEHWLRTAIRRTVWPFVGVAVIFGIAGFTMQQYAPQAKSVGHVIKAMKAP
jgi:hypothetical protein